MVGDNCNFRHAVSICKLPQPLVHQSKEYWIAVQDIPVQSNLPNKHQECMSNACFSIWHYGMEC